MGAASRWFPVRIAWQPFISRPDVRRVDRGSEFRTEFRYPIMFNQFVPILLQAPAGGGGLFGLLLPMVLIFVLFYFMIILPQRKRQKAVDEMLNNLKPGDRVVTSGGVYGSIVSIREDKRTVQLRISENPVVRIEIARSSISGLQEGGEEAK